MDIGGGADIRTGATGAARGHGLDRTPATRHRPANSPTTEAATMSRAPTKMRSRPRNRPADPSPVDEPEKPDGTTSARTATPKAGPDGLHTAEELLRPRSVTQISGHRAANRRRPRHRPHDDAAREVVQCNRITRRDPGSPTSGLCRGRLPDGTGTADRPPSTDVRQSRPKWTIQTSSPSIDRRRCSSRSTADRPQLRTPRSLIDAVGSVVLKMLSAIVHLLDDRPCCLCAPNTCGLHLTLPIGSGKSKPTGISRRTPIPPHGSSYLQHGFPASGPMYSYTAASSGRTHQQHRGGPVTVIEFPRSCRGVGRRWTDATAPWPICLSVSERP